MLISGVRPLLDGFHVAEVVPGEPSRLVFDLVVEARPAPEGAVLRLASGEEIGVLDLTVSPDGSIGEVLLSLAASHALQVGDTVTVVGIDEDIDGPRVLTAADGGAATPTVQFVLSRTGPDGAVIELPERGFLRSDEDLNLTLLLSPSDADEPSQAIVSVPFTAAAVGTVFDAAPALTEAAEAGYRAVSIIARDADGRSVTELDDQVRILFDPPAEGAVPVTSDDGGITWTILPELDRPNLTPGQRHGYYVEEDGRIWILTRHLSLFGLLAEQSVPITVTAPVTTLGIGVTTDLTISGGEGDGLLSVRSVTPSVCSVDGLVVTALRSGSCTIEATRAPSSWFIAATGRLTLSVPAPSVPSSPSTPSAPTPSEAERAAAEREAAAAAERSAASIAARVAEQARALVERIAAVVEAARSPLGISEALREALTRGDGAAMLVDGEVVELRIEGDPQGVALILTADGFLADLRVLGADGTVRPLLDGMLAGVQGGQLVITSSGWAPGSTVVLWLYSEPTKLAEIVVDASGSFPVTATIPAGMTPGEHLIQLVGPSPDGDLRVLAAGLLVDAAESATAEDPGRSETPGDDVVGIEGDREGSRGRGGPLLVLGLILLVGAMVLVVRRGVGARSTLERVTPEP
jgi:hypothetical protein